MRVYDKIINRKSKIAVVGLGYVGLPIAIAFSKKADVIGYDISVKKIKSYSSGLDVTKEIGDEVLKQSSIQFTNDEKAIKEASLIVITVPTPINSDHTPDLTPVISASETVGRNLTNGAIVVYESTVYPGCTEDVCIPILEDVSGLKCGLDFKVGYSPERINPGDKIHRLENIVKIISACDVSALNEIQSIYKLIIDAGTYTVSSIKTAEAIKIVENSQRDINIAFMNEMAMVFDKMGIDTNEVVDGMNTKWNALGFRPGLVGGHCIGVDPYYFTYESEKLGYHSQIVINGRNVNEGMGTYIADMAINEITLAGIEPMNARVAVFGLAFKENCSDIRNSKVIDIISRLNEKGIDPIIIDPVVNPKDAFEEYKIELKSEHDIHDMDCLIIAVAHDCFKVKNINDIKRFYKQGLDYEKIILDVKGMYELKELQNSGMRYWRL